MTIKEIYAKYLIMPQLETHMLRVAYVASAVLSGLKNRVFDEKLVLKSCLLHDLGNIAKFNFDKPLLGDFNFTKNEVLFWKNHQREFISHYGKDVHQATTSICLELKAHAELAVIEEEVKLHQKHPTTIDFDQASIAALMLMYADLRVGPSGITLFKNRIRDLEIRYNKPADYFNWAPPFESYIKNMGSTELDLIVEPQGNNVLQQFLKLEI